MSDFYSRFDAAGKAFDENALSSCDDATLQTHLIALANEPVPNAAVQHRNIIRGITINHLLLQRHIDGLNKQNSKTQRLVIALTVASLIGSAIQIWYGYKADKRAEEDSRKSEEKHTGKQSQTSLPTQGQPQSKNQASSAAGTAATISTKP